MWVSVAWQGWRQQPAHFLRGGLEGISADLLQRGAVSLFWVWGTRRGSDDVESKKHGTERGSACQPHQTQCDELLFMSCSCMTYRRVSSMF